MINLTEVILCDIATCCLYLRSGQLVVVLMAQSACQEIVKFGNVLKNAIWKRYARKQIFKI